MARLRTPWALLPERHSENGPVVLPFNRAQHELGGPIHLTVVIVINVEVSIAVAKGGAPTGADVAPAFGEKLKRVALKHPPAAALRIRPRDRRRAADHGSIGAVDAFAARIIGHEQVVVAVVR